ncbi:DUF5993 family protein [Burkholderia alba]|uniref:DUF5993 family protein n=1 Tax=Burkholderia alba TaxID=2683677 RepID=UPI002B0609F1|nr:DUF5993 family protein [Burkholderia alba]
MFMFLPFLLSLVSVAAIICDVRSRAAMLLIAITLIVTLASFMHHMTDSLNLSF